MLADVIILAAVAILAGYAGAQWQKKQQGSITKREATELIKSVSEMREVFDGHIEVHKIMNHQIETLDHNIGVVAKVVGVDQSPTFH